MTTIKEGERVRIASRAPTEEDTKSGLYYSHYAGLTGTVQKIYNKNEIAVEVEHESLSKEIRKRHDDVRDQMKTKWLEGLSEEGRSKLTEREKDFNLRYVILVAQSDLEKAGARPSAKPQKELPSLEQPADSQSARKSLADLEAAEEQEFLRRAQQQK